MVGEEQLILPEILGQVNSPTPLQKTPISNRYPLVAPH